MGVTMKDLPDLVSVARTVGVNLVRDVDRWSGACPFHEDMDSSFTIYQGTDRQRFRCLGCGVRGDVIEFVRRLHRLDFQGAIRFLKRFVPAPNSMAQKPNHEQGQHRQISEFEAALVEELEVLTRAAYKHLKYLEKEMIEGHEKFEENADFYFDLCSRAPIWENHHRILTSGSDGEKLKLLKKEYDYAA